MSLQMATLVKQRMENKYTVKNKQTSKKTIFNPPGLSD